MRQSLDINKISPLASDKRGDIIHLMEVNSRIKDVLLIISKRGAVRANHYHKRDTHWVYLISGKFKYFEKRSGLNDKLISTTILPGDMVVSKPGIIHAMKFIQDSTMVVFTTEKREPARYEKDTIRIKII